MTFRSSRVIGRGASAATVAVVALNVSLPGCGCTICGGARLLGRARDGDGRRDAGGDGDDEDGDSDHDVTYRGHGGRRLEGSLALRRPPGPWRAASGWR